jgi:hypothetical protein
LQSRLPLHQVGGLRRERVVGAVEVVDQKRERGGVRADQAPLHLRLAPDLHRRDKRHQERDEPDLDGPARPAAQRGGAPKTR